MFDKSKLTKPLFGENLLSERSFQVSFSEGKNNRQSLNGNWPFIFADDLDEQWLKADFDTANLKTIPVPAHFELQGYGRPQYVNVMYPWDGKEKLDYDHIPTDNPCGVYFKDIDVQKDDGKNYILEFHGFEAALYVYVNGQYVGYSTQNYTRSLFLLDEFLLSGRNRITLVVFKYSFTSWFTDQDMWRFAGIFRDVNLLVVPKKHIEDIEVKAPYELTGESDFSLTVKASSASSCTLSVKLYDDSEVLIDEEVPFEKDVVNFNKTGLKVKPWSDEDPHLYKLDLSLKEGVELERTSLKVGFRTVTIKGSQILLNGKKIVFYGVNRHEFDAISGRVMDEKTTLEDLYFMKRHNINALRTCHYPNNVFLYDLCDELGILLMDENSIETHGTWMMNQWNKDCKKLCLPGDDEKYWEIVLMRGKAMLERDKNHCSIVSYSLGNESYVGENLRKLANYFRKRDPSRFVHYEGCSFDDDYRDLSDVISRMYPKPKAVEKTLLKEKNIPYLMCEFAHSMGNSTGNFDEYMSLLERFPQYHLGFIWDFMDQGLYKDGKYYFGGDFGDYPNDDNFNANGLLTADKKENSKTQTVTYHYSKVRARFTDFKIVIHSYRSYISTADLEFKYTLLENGKIVFEENFELDIKPLEEGEYQIPQYDYKANCTYVQQLSYRKKNFDEVYKDTILYVEQRPISSCFKTAIIPLTHEKGDKLVVEEHSYHLSVSQGDFRVIFYRPLTTKGGFDGLYLGKDCYLHNLVLPTLFRANVDNDETIESILTNPYIGASMYPARIPLKRELKVISKKDDEVVVRVIHTFLIGKKISRFKEKYTVRSDRTIEVEFAYRKRSFMAVPDTIGMIFPFDKELSSFSYIGKGPYDSYPDKHLGMPYGYYESDSHAEYVNYPFPQECGNHVYTSKVSIPMNGKKLSFYAIDQTFSFSYLPYNPFQIQVSKRSEDLPKSTKNYLTIRSFIKGVGGDDSWGARVHKQYRMKDEKYIQSFLIKIED